MLRENILKVGGKHISLAFSKMFQHMRLFMKKKTKKPIFLGKNAESSLINLTPTVSS